MNISRRKFMQLGAASMALSNALANACSIPSSQAFPLDQPRSPKPSVEGLQAFLDQALGAGLWQHDEEDAVVIKSPEHSETHVAHITCEVNLDTVFGYCDELRLFVERHLGYRGNKWKDYRIPAQFNEEINLMLPGGYLLAREHIGSYTFSDSAIPYISQRILTRRSDFIIIAAARIRTKHGDQWRVQTSGLARELMSHCGGQYFVDSMRQITP